MNDQMPLFESINGYLAIDQLINKIDDSGSKFQYTTC